MHVIHVFASCFQRATVPDHDPRCGCRGWGLDQGVPMVALRKDGNPQESLWISWQRSAPAMAVVPWVLVGGKMLVVICMIGRRRIRPKRSSDAGTWQLDPLISPWGIVVSGEKRRGRADALGSSANCRRFNWPVAGPTRRGSVFRVGPPRSGRSGARCLSTNLLPTLALFLPAFSHAPSCIRGRSKLAIELLLLCFLLQLQLCALDSVNTHSDPSFSCFGRH